MTVALILFAASIAATAEAVSTLIWRRFATLPPNRWEAWASSSVLAFAIAIAVSWMLSWFDLLDRIPLLVVALMMAAPSVLYLHRAGILKKPVTLGLPRYALLALFPLVLWITFVLWRGAILPVLSHDALAYHMPKAVMLARAHHFTYFDAPDPRISTSPANYEMLLADVLLLSGSDQYTEWIGTASYITLLLLAAALARRWWGNGPHIAAIILLTAATPVILLHAGAHKNDLFANVFYLAALFWGGRWLASQEIAPLLLMLVSGASAAGTKLQAAFLFAALLAVAAFLLVRGRLRLHKKQVGIIFLSIPIAFLLFGGWAYVTNFTRTGRAALPASSSSDAGYGDWNNVWEVPALMLMRPFDPSEAHIYVPWRGEHWFWPRFELFFSDFGGVLTLLVLILPWSVRRYFSRGSDLIRRERMVTSIAATLAFVLMLPIKIRPLGFFAGFPRYFVFIAIIVLAWTIGPALRELALRRRRLYAQTVCWGCAAVLISISINYSANDHFQSFNYVVFVTNHPGLRLPHFAIYRAATVVDQIAGPEDTIAVDAGFDSWIYPLYGETLQRKVIFIDPRKPIPSEARFVIVDRTWNIIWGDPRFKNTGQYLKYLAQGEPTEEDTAVVKRLFADQKTYAPIYFLRRRNQAVFKKHDSGTPPPRVAAPNDGSSD
jgi:hypothetical protein